MDYFKKLPGFKRSPAGLEYRILKHIHYITLIGTLLPLVFLGLIYLLAGLESHDFKLLFIFVVSLILLHWTLVMTLWIGCWIVRVMKGPAYVADAYERPDVNDPDEPIDGLSRR